MKRDMRPISFPSSSSSLLSHQSLMAETNASGNKSAPSGMDEKEVKEPNLIERAKEEIQSMFQHDKAHCHDKETHGTSEEIDETTPADEVKGPNVFERMKEEVEAVVDAVHPKK